MSEYYSINKHIIILGEEYWFVDQGYNNSSHINKYKNRDMFAAQYLLNYLEENKNKNIEYTIIKNPNELLHTINMLGTENIKGIFLFQDVLSDAYLNNMSILEMKKYLINLGNKGIYIYPTPDNIDIYASKKYNLLLNDNIPWAVLPRTKVYKIENYDVKYEDKIANDMWLLVNDLWKTFDTVVIKKGYSYEGKQVEYFNKKYIKNFNDFKDMINNLNYKNFWGVETSSIKLDKGSTRYYILQGFNGVIDNYEYRVFFNNGKIVYIADDDIIANTCISDGMNDPLKKEVINFAIKLYDEYIKLFWNQPRQPILFRIDVSYAMDKVFQDKHSINVEGFDSKIRLYANELEIDPTSFFYNDYDCTTDEFFSSRFYQETLGMDLTEYINSIL
jgi:hypothetical protein